MTDARQMPFRHPSGRFSARRNPLALYEIVGAVALIAADRDEDPVKDPRTVTQADWNSARYALESVFGSIPQANEVCRQLSDSRGRPYPWRELLALVFDPTKDVAQIHKARLAVPARPVSRGQAERALLMVAAHTKQPSLLPHEYRQGRQRVIEASQPKHRASIARALPTDDQIVNAFVGDWDSALENAGLCRRSPARPPGLRAAVAVEDAIVFYYGKLGHLPTIAQLDDFAAREQFAKQAKTRRWHEHIDTALRRIRELSWPDPPPYGAGAPADWEPLQGEPIEAPARYTRRYFRRQVIAAVQEFTDTLAGDNPTDRRWRDFSRGRRDIPSLNVIKAHGGLRNLIMEVAQPGWETRAESWVDPRAAANKARPKVSPAESALRRASSDEAQAVLDVMRPCHEVTAKDLASRLDWTVPKVRHWLDVLRTAGLVVQTQAWARSKKQSYRLTEP